MSSLQGLREPLVVTALDKKFFVFINTVFHHRVKNLSVDAMLQHSSCPNV